MKLTYIPFLFFILSLYYNGKAQDTIPEKPRGYPPALFFELGGHGGIYSVGIDKILFLFTRESHFNWSAGCAIVPLPGRAVVDFPVSIKYNYVAWKSGRMIELGTGQTLVVDVGGGKGGTIRGTFRAGYTCYRKRHFWSAAYTPFYSYLNNFQWEHWAGISYGHYLLKKK